MADLPYLPLWTNDYIADTTHLTTEQHGAYLLLLMKAWRRPDNAIPDDPQVMCRMAGIDPRKWPGVWSVLKVFFLLGDDGLWHQKRLDKERDRAQRRGGDEAREQRRAAGRASAEKRKQQREGNETATDGQRDPNGPLNGPLNETGNGQPTESNELRVRVIDSSLRSESNEPQRKRTKRAASPEFECWYAAYPRHEDRGPAEKAYAKAIAAGAEHADLLAGASRYAAKVRGKDREFTKLPATWLNNRCWLDDAPKAAAPDRARHLAAWARHGIVWKAENGAVPTIAEQDAAKRAYIEHVVAFADNRTPWNADLYGVGRPDFGEIDRARAVAAHTEVRPVSAAAEGGNGIAPHAADARATTVAGGPQLRMVRLQ